MNCHFCKKECGEADGTGGGKLASISIGLLKKGGGCDCYASYLCHSCANEIVKSKKLKPRAESGFINV